MNDFVSPDSREFNTWLAAKAGILMSLHGSVPISLQAMQDFHVHSCGGFTPSMLAQCN